MSLLDSGRVFVKELSVTVGSKAAKNYQSESDSITWTVTPKETLLTSEEADILSLEMIQRLSKLVALSRFAKDKLNPDEVSKTLEAVGERFTALITRVTQKSI